MKADLIRSVSSHFSQTPATANVMVGFDGFVDEIIRLVDKRESVDAYTAIPTIAEFGKRISAAAGLSANIEMVPEQVKLGGNGPIMANNLVCQGYGVTYVGAIGAAGNIHPVFEEFASQCKSVISVTDPAHTDALEFEDGKIMMGKMNTLPSVNWDSLLAQCPQTELQAIIDDVELVGCTNWTMLPLMNTILSGLGELFAKRPTRCKLFVDLADPAKRSREDIVGVLKLLGELEAHVDVVLGLNEAESEQISEALLGEVNGNLMKRAQEIRTDMGVSQIVIHPTKCAAAASKDGEWEVVGPFTPTPKLTTGAGDNFNAGYCNGLLSGCAPEACLVAGVSSSGFYVRNCRSATREELVSFMGSWADVDGGDLP